VELSAAIEDLLGVERVDLVILSEADPFLSANMVKAPVGDRADQDPAHTKDALFRPQSSAFSTLGIVGTIHFQPSVVHRETLLFRN
jgi:hypothetical protein